MAREGLKNQSAISTTAIMENFETEVLRMLTFTKVDSLTCACGILGLVVPEQKKGNLKLLGWPHKLHKKIPELFQDISRKITLFSKIILKDRK